MLDFHFILQNYAMKSWEKRGVPKHKLIVGIPFYGRSFILRNADRFEPGQSASVEREAFAGPFTQEKGFISYLEICSLEKEGGWTKRRDSDGNVYMTKGKQWIGFDTPGSVLRKVNGTFGGQFFLS